MPILRRLNPIRRHVLKLLDIGVRERGNPPVVGCVDGSEFGGKRDYCPVRVVDFLETGVVYYVSRDEEVLGVGDFVFYEVGDCVVADEYDVVVFTLESE
jgi:hypothetical protein